MVLHLMSAPTGTCKAEVLRIDIQETQGSPHSDLEDSGAHHVLSTEVVLDFIIETSQSKTKSDFGNQFLKYSGVTLI